jgi:hypothetical protein
MKNKQKGSVLLIVLLIVVVIGLIVYFKQSQRSETNTQVQTIVEKDMLGLWAPGVDGDERMGFAVDDKGVHHYDSWLNKKPSHTGTWSLDSGKLTITYTVPKGKSRTFSLVREGKNLTLKDAAGVATSTFVGEYKY